MKKLLALLLVFTCFSFSTPTNQDVKLKVTNIKPLGDGKFAVDMQLHNAAGLKVSYLSMYCSDSGFYVTDHPDVTISPKPCDKNFPIKATIPKRNYRTADVQLQLAKTATQAQFKIGLKFIEIPESMMLSEFDSSSVKSVTLWSNTIELRNR